MKKKKTKRSVIPKGHVGIAISVKVTDPQKPRGHKKMEKFLAVECSKYLEMLFDPKINSALFQVKDSKRETEN